jgi:TolA-binding protein
LRAVLEAPTPVPEPDPSHTPGPWEVPNFEAVADDPATEADRVRAKLVPRSFFGEGERPTRKLRADGQPPPEPPPEGATRELSAVVLPEEEPAPRRTSEATTDPEMRRARLGQAPEPHREQRQTGPSLPAAAAPSQTGEWRRAAAGRPRGFRLPGSGPRRGLVVAVLGIVLVGLVAFIVLRTVFRSGATPPGGVVATAAAPAEPSGEELYGAAVLALEAGKTGEAEAGLKALLTKQAAHAGALASLGVLLYDAGRYAEALPVFERLVAADQGNADAYWHLGQAARAAGDRARARVALERFLDLAPADHVARDAVQETLRTL